MTNVQKAIGKLREHYGSYRAVADAVGAGHTYIYRIYTGEKKPSAKVASQILDAAHGIGS